MKCLLTGGTGLLGFDLLHQAPRHWDIVMALHRRQALPPLRDRVKTVALNLTDREHVATTVAQICPDVVIHTASIGDLDRCERHRDEAWEVNVMATRWLLDACHPFDTIFVFLSTIYVFDGRNPPYDEYATTNPLCYYAKTKLEAENLVLQLSKHPVIMRPMPMYGWHLPSQRSNCVTWLLRKLSQRESVRIVDDVFSNYLWVGDASLVVLAAIQRQACGVFLLGGPEPLSRYELSLKVADVFGYDRKMISPVTSDHFPFLTPRPKDSTCTIEKIEKELGVIPLNPEHGLRRMLSIEKAKPSYYRL